MTEAHQGLAGLPPALNFPEPFYAPGWRDASREQCPAQEHNTMSPARVQTRTAHSGVERTNHEPTAPSTTRVLLRLKNVLPVLTLTYVLLK